MANTAVGRIALRRHYDYEYEQVATSFIPLKGEVCFVDTTDDGLRVKVGNGVDPIGRVPYLDEDLALNILIKGYLYEGQFYSDSALTQVIVPSVNKIYINNSDNTVYVFNGNEYVAVSQTIAAATASEAGVAKLYDSLGENEDGAITQKVITEELDKKVELTADKENELLIFTTN